MADYIYLLENRLSKAQQNAILAVRTIARAKGLTVFLVGGAVRDLTSGSPVRDLDVAVQGNALKLKKDMEKAGAVVTGENEAMQQLFVQFPGCVRMEIGSTLSVHYPKPGKPVVKPAAILEDLRRRDFTANAMALSLNEGSYGLLMDPLNGVADIENREFRLVSNYGFIEDPIRMVRAARFTARLGWQMEEKTKARYETGKAEGYISAMSAFLRGYETEEIVHEEEPLRVMRGLEAEGWMKKLAPAWGSTKVNLAELEKLREAHMHLQMQGIAADTSAALFPLLTAKMAPKDMLDLKRSFPRKGFVAEIDALPREGKHFVADFGSKQAATPSAAWKLLMAAKPEAVLWAAYANKSAPLQAKFKAFYTEWPQARQKIPYPLMQEMRIIPELSGFDELVEKVFFELMDGKLGTVEEMKAFLEPYSPPAPPPPVHLRRARATKKDAKATKARKKVATSDGDDADALEVVAAAIDSLAASGQTREEPVIAVSKLGSVKGAGKSAASQAAKAPVPVAKTAKPAVKASAPVAKMPVPTPAKKPVGPPVKAAPAKKVVAAKPSAKKAVPVKTAPKKASPAKAAAKKATPAKTAVKKAVAKKAVVRVPVKKAHAKKPAGRTAVKTATAKKAPAKTVKRSAAKQSKPALKKKKMR
jgi:tRNA nucleotidyltransferase (CCA-adding enzyme)